MPLLRDRVPEGHVLLSGISWTTYLALLKDLAEFPGVRVAYDRGVLEIMSPSQLHEVLKTLLARMLEILTLELNIDCQCAGSTTWKREDVERGIEPDECYYIASEARVRGKDQVDLLVDPPPDLAIEVDLEKPMMEKLGIYAGLGIPEVWKCDGERLSVFLLQGDGSYLESGTSASFPFFEVDALARFLARRHDASQTALMREFRDWVRSDLGKHARP